MAHSELRDAGGPPSDLDDFAGFMRVLAGRYAGRVDAYEIWKSPNLLKYWYLPKYAEPPKMDAKGDYALPDAIQIGAAHYLPLLEAAFRAVKAVDASALVITAGLAPVGFSDNYNAVETGTFLHNMLHGRRFGLQRRHWRDLQRFGCAAGAFLLREAAGGGDALRIVYAVLSRDAVSVSGYAVGAWRR